MGMYAGGHAPGGHSHAKALQEWALRLPGTARVAVPGPIARRRSNLSDQRVGSRLTTTSVKSSSWCSRPAYARLAELGLVRVGQFDDAVPCTSSMTAGIGRFLRTSLRSAARNVATRSAAGRSRDQRAIRHSTNTTMAPMIDSRKPAGWKAEPGAAGRLDPVSLAAPPCVPADPSPRSLRLQLDRQRLDLEGAERNVEPQVERRTRLETMGDGDRRQ